MSDTTPRLNGFATAVVFEGGLALFALLLAWFFRVPLREQVPDWGPALGIAVGRGLIITVPMLAAFWWLVRSDWQALVQLRDQVQWLVREMFPEATVAQLALVALLAGMGEELLFRGVIQWLLVDWTTPVTGLLLTSLLFGAAHALSRLYFILATAIALVFGWVTLYYRDLVAPMVAHTVYDFVALLYIAKYAHPATPRDVHPGEQD